MTINCIIIDDEPLARAGMKEYVADVDFLHLAGTFDNPLAAAGLLNPVLAGAAMAMSSVSVISNALLLRRWHRR